MTFAIASTRKRQIRSMRESSSSNDGTNTTGKEEALLTMCSGCDPLTPDDVAEVIVFAAGRRENVVLADALLFPSHQV